MSTSRDTSWARKSIQSWMKKTKTDFWYLYTQALRRGAMAKETWLFHVHKRTTICLWKVWTTEGRCTPSGKKNNSRPILYDREELKLYVEELPVPCRRSIRALTGYLGISYNCVQTLITNKKILFPHKSAINLCFQRKTSC